jgi:hypothetical protein
MAVACQLMLQSPASFAPNPGGNEMFAWQLPLFGVRTLTGAITIHGIALASAALAPYRETAIVLAYHRATKDQITRPFDTAICLR